jgi:hypothetical protein
LAVGLDVGLVVGLAGGVDGVLVVGGGHVKFICVDFS